MLARALTIGVALGLAAICASGASAQDFTTLYSFCSQGGTRCTDGQKPQSGLVQGTDGDFCGTTFDGGAYSWGTIFKLSPAGDLTTLHSFCPQNGCLDGAYPLQDLIRAKDGSFYGTTSRGGGGQGGGILNLCGTVFKMTPDGTLTNLYGFCEGDFSDGRVPLAALVQASDGDFYGTTAYGGNSGICTSVTTDGCGTIFRVTPGGAHTTLYRFGMNCAAGSVNCADGQKPSAPLIQASDGNLYGTTPYGGNTAACTSPQGCGTLFRIAPGGAFTTVYRFCSESNCEDGSFPMGALMQAEDGYIYGTVASGGTHGAGAVFRLTLSGGYSLVYSFGSQSGDGHRPYAGLIQATDGSFYGTTQIGGASGYGSVFRLASDGSQSTIYSFCPESGCVDGKYPTARVIQGTDGNLYGTTYNGGSAGFGTVYRLTTGEAYLEVSIDIKPGDASNTINLKSNGVVPVAILGSATFDPMTVDPSTITFAGAPVATRGRSALMTGQSDVNHDGYPDLVLYFRTQDLTDLQPPPAPDSRVPNRES